MPLPIILFLAGGGAYGLYKGVRDGLSVVTPVVAIGLAVYLYKRGV